MKKLARNKHGMIRGEKGAILILALILMAVGLLLVIPLLSFMGSGLRSTNQVYDMKAKELYAADAGVRYAIAEIKSVSGSHDWQQVPQGTGSTLGDQQAIYKIIDLGDNNPYGSPSYRIVAEGGPKGIDLSTSNQKTTITCDVILVDFFQVFTKNAISSESDITGRGNNDYVYGNVQTQGAVDPSINTYVNTYLTSDAPAGATTIRVANTDNMPSSGIAIFDTDNETINYGTIDTANDTLILNQPVTSNHYMGEQVSVTSQIDTTDITWPPTNPVQVFYSNQVSSLAPFTNTTINVSQADQTGPLRVDNGDPNTIYTITGTGTLTGTIYVNGNLYFDKNADVTLGNGDFYATELSADIPIGTTTLPVYSTITPSPGFPASGNIVVGTGDTQETLPYSNKDDNNFMLSQPTVYAHSKDERVYLEGISGQTIFVTGTISMSTHSTVSGPGAIIANGNIQFWPNLANNGQYIYIMSVNGSVDFQPQGGQGTDFYGSVAGQSVINLQPNVTINWSDPTGIKLNLPGSDGYANVPAGLQTWIIK